MTGDEITRHLRDQFGITDILNRLHRMETAMASASQQLTDLSSRFDDFTSDVRAAMSALAAERENLTPDGQAALDLLSQKLDAADTEVGDADGSQAPPPDEGEIPA